MVMGCRGELFCKRSAPFSNTRLFNRFFLPPRVQSTIAQFTHILLWIRHTMRKKRYKLNAWDFNLKEWAFKRWHSTRFSFTHLFGNSSSFMEYTDVDRSCILPLSFATPCDSADMGPCEKRAGSKTDIEHRAVFQPPSPMFDGSCFYYRY